MQKIRLLFTAFLTMLLLFSSSVRVFAALDVGPAVLWLNGKKMLNIPFFNQYLEPNGSTYPASGWQMCGASSAVLSISKFGKLSYNTNDDHSLKVLMYKDARIDGNNPKCGYNKGGAFQLTNYNCNTNYAGGIQNYIRQYGNNSTFTTRISMATIKSAIDRGHPVIFGMGDKYDGNFGHIALIIGYTYTGKIIVHDTYTNIQGLGRGWRSYYTGKAVEYDLFSSRWPINYLIEVY